MMNNILFFLPYVGKTISYTNDEKSNKKTIHAPRKSKVVTAKF